MRKREKLGSVVFPRLYRLRHASEIHEITLLRIGSDDQSESNEIELGLEFVVPRFSALRLRREITIFSLSRVTEAHGHMSDFFGVIKIFIVHAQPLSQGDTARIVPGDATFMNVSTRRLAYDQNTTFAIGLNHRSRAVRESLLAQPAGANLA